MNKLYIYNKIKNYFIDYEYYREKNKDLRIMNNYNDLFNHAIIHGYKEQRIIIKDKEINEIFKHCCYIYNNYEEFKFRFEILLI